MIWLLNYFYDSFVFYLFGSFSKFLFVGGKTSMIHTKTLNFNANTVSFSLSLSIECLCVCVSEYVGLSLCVCVCGGIWRSLSLFLSLYVYMYVCWSVCGGPSHCLCTSLHHTHFLPLSFFSLCMSVSPIYLMVPLLSVDSSLCKSLSLSPLSRFTSEQFHL